MIYCDTSLLIALLTPEPDSKAARAWLGSRPADTLVVSPWVDTEIASAVAIKVRTRALSDAYLAAALTGWQHMRSVNFKIEPVVDHHFRQAALLAGQPGLKLRAGDALHLAIAADRGFALATLDKAMATAARAIGIVVEAVPPPA